MNDGKVLSAMRMAIGCALALCILTACRGQKAGLSRPTGLAAAADGRNNRGVQSPAGGILRIL